jgi:hypothetical protein
LAFTGCPLPVGPTATGATCPLLLVADEGSDAVHLIDAGGGVHVGNAAPPGTIEGPRGVAARGCLVAVSAWKDGYHGQRSIHVLQLVEGARGDAGGSVWAPLRTISCEDGHTRGMVPTLPSPLCQPIGLRFTTDLGTVGSDHVVVADSRSGKLPMFRVTDGEHVRDVADLQPLDGPCDLEQCGGGWVVACLGAPVVHLVPGARDSLNASTDAPSSSTTTCADACKPSIIRLMEDGEWDDEFCYPTALAAVAGLGLVVRECGRYHGRVQVFMTREAAAMATMSIARVAWLVSVTRGMESRARGARRHGGLADATTSATASVPLCPSGPL